MTSLVILRAADDAALVDEMSRVLGYLERVAEVQLADVAYTCSLTKGPAAIGIVADTVQTLRERLFSARSRMITGGVKRLRDKGGTYYYRDRLLGEGKGKLAFVFPGVIGFRPGMLRDLTLTHPECRSAFEELQEAMADDPEFSPADFIFPPAERYRHDADVFSSGAYAQALVSTYSASMALARMLCACGLKCDGVTGSAGGDLAAMVMAGYAGTSRKRPDRIRLVREIYGIVRKAVEHGGFAKTVMLTVLLRHEGEADQVFADFPSDKVTMAVDFSPRQKTYAVAPDFEEEAMRRFAEGGIRVMKLALDRPFNTPACEKLVPAVRKFADNWMKSEPVCEVYSCATTCLMPERLRRAREEMASRWAQCVRFGDTLRNMHANGYRVFLEVGPKGLMTAAVEDALKGEEFAAISMNSIHRSGMLQAQHALAQLAALGAEFDISDFLKRSGARMLDFDSQFAPMSRGGTEMRLSRSFPRMTLLSTDSLLPDTASALGAPSGRGQRAALRAEAVAAAARRNRQFDFGAVNPLVSDADTVNAMNGVEIEIRKTFRLSDAPFLGDFAIGTSQLSYSDPNLRGLVLLTFPVAMEIMAETATMLVPGRFVLRLEDVTARGTVEFKKGALSVTVKASRVASGNADLAAVKVQIRKDEPGSDFVWPLMEATVVLAKTPPPVKASAYEALTRPKAVHWSTRDIYPKRISCGSRLRGISFVETWSETGLDYEVTVPKLAGNVTYTRFPLWAVNPILFETIASGFTLWRSHERFASAVSFPFKLRRLDFHAPLPKEGTHLKCYLRLTGVTPETHIADITVSDGNGSAVMTLSGWEEKIEHIPSGYRSLITQPAVAFITDSLPAKVLGESAAEVSSAFVTGVPYSLFQRNDCIWLKTLSHVVLNERERRRFEGLTGSVSRFTEWLFGRIAAKEAVRRLLRERYQARWSAADVEICPNADGKPMALGKWADDIVGKLDIAIAHTEDFIVSVAAMNMRIGIDVEAVKRDLSAEFTEGVFAPEERDLASGTENASRSLILFWCAKEAVSKALGVGIKYAPREMNVVACDPEKGELAIRLGGAWETAFSKLRGRDLTVSARIIHEHALAFVAIPQAMLELETE